MIATPANNSPVLATQLFASPAGLPFAATAPQPEGCKGDVSPLPSSPFEQNAQMDVAGLPTDAANTRDNQSANGANELPPGERV